MEFCCSAQLSRPSKNWLNFKGGGGHLGIIPELCLFCCISYLRSVSESMARRMGRICSSERQSNPGWWSSLLIRLAILMRQYLEWSMITFEEKCQNVGLVQSEKGRRQCYLGWRLSSYVNISTVFFAHKHRQDESSGSFPGFIVLLCFDELWK